MNPPTRSTSDPQQNHLLSALPPAEWARWSPQVERFELAQGPVLRGQHEQGRQHRLRWPKGEPGKPGDGSTVIVMPPAASAPAN